MLWCTKGGNDSKHKSPKYYNFSFKFDQVCIPVTEQVAKQVCQDVPRQDCKDVTNLKCALEPITSCTKVAKQVPRQDCRTVPREVKLINHFYQELNFHFPRFVLMCQKPHANLWPAQAVKMWPKMCAMMFVRISIGARCATQIKNSTVRWHPKTIIPHGIVFLWKNFLKYYTTYNIQNLFCWNKACSC